MDSKIRERFQHRLSPQLFSSDEGPETGDESDEDIVRSYLPPDNHDIMRAFEPHHNIPAINITLHSPNANHVLESEICQLADIQDSIQRMREGELVPPNSDKQSVEARLSSSCPSLTVESGEEGDTPTPRRRSRQQHYKDHKSHRKRSGRPRSPSVSTGESDEEVSEGLDFVDGHQHRSGSTSQPNTARDRTGSNALPAHFHPGLPRPTEAVNPAMGVARVDHLSGGLPSLHKSVSTPSMVQNDVNNDNIPSSGKSSRRARVPEPTHVFIQKLIAEHGWTNQRSGTDSETEGEEATATRERENGANHVRYMGAPVTGGQVPSPQLTLAEFLQNPALSEEERSKRRRNKKERGGSLFSLRKKKDKKDGKGLAKAGSAVSLQSRVVTAPRVPQHSYSMSSLKRYPPPTSQFYLARSESSKSAEDREDIEGDRENLLESELLPAEDFPEGFPISLRNLDTDPFLRIQKEEPETWAASVPEGVASALKPHEAKRQEHIYEFIMTEKHHCQLLKVIQKVFCEGMVTYLDMKPELLDRLFPQLETLISLHFEFLRQLRERQDSTAVIPTIADILINQFQEDNAGRWRSAYGAFCSQHLDAVSIYKDIIKNDRRFQEFVQQCSNNPLLRKMGIPECILTVTTRITKYPLLIEPLIKTAKERPEEQQKLRNCLHLVKSILVDVNGQVAEKERGQRLLEIYNRMDARSHVSHEGRKFKKSDILSENRKLLFEGVGTLLSPALTGSSSGRGNRSPAPMLVSVVVLSDVVVFLQDTNQKYTFITPDHKSGVVPVHSLMAREKPGTDNKALYLISTSDKEPEMYEFQVVQPRDRQDWIAGIRRAVDLSTGGPGEDSQFESEAEQARKQLEAKYMKMRQLTSELRGKDMELARLLEDKMRVLSEMLDELGVDHPLEPTQAKYLHLVQEKEAGSVTKEQLLQEVQEATKLASSLYSSGNNLGRSVSSVGEHVSEGYESPSLPKRAETFGGFDNTLTVQTKNVKKKPSESVQFAELGLPATPPLLALDKSQQATAVHMTHYLNNIMCMVSEHFTSLEGFKVELTECKERAALGWGRYKHNQQLEELRTLQEQLSQERRMWQAHKEEQEKDICDKQEVMNKMQSILEQERKDVEQQRNKLYRKLEALQAQGFDIGPNMAVIGPSMHQTNSEPAFVMEVRKAVSPPGQENRKNTHAQPPTDRKPSHLPPPSNNSKKNSESKNLHLLSATNESKGDLSEIKQQIPYTLAKLSLAGSKNKDKKSCSKLVERPSISAPILTTGHHQMLPFKLSENDRKASSPKAGYQKLSSNSFAEDRIGRAQGREEVSHSRTGSSPASMTGRPMSNTLPKSVGRTGSPEKDKPLKEIQKVNYADSGEEVFFF